MCRHDDDEELGTRTALVTDPQHSTNERVYNPTTVPMVAHSRSPMLSETSSISTDIGSEPTTNTGGQGDPNELGIPRSSVHRWLPTAQRELLQKQANMFFHGRQKKQETDIF